MAVEKSINKGGRPRRSREDGLLSRSLTFRVRPALYDRVQSAAAAEQRSLSEEIEARLIRSFEREAIDQQRFGDPEIVFLANLVASIASLIQRKTGKSCVSDPETHEAVKNAVAEVFDCSMGLLGDVSNVPAAQQRFDRILLDELTTQTIMAASRATDDIKDIIDR